MPFEGELNLVSLESVLRNIDVNALTGTLSIRDESGTRKIAFAAGKIVAFLAVPGEARAVPDALAKKGLISREDVEKARTSLAWKRMNLKRALEYRGLVKEQDYAQAVRDEVIVAHVLELFMHPERSFRFEEGGPFERGDPYDQDQLAAELRVHVEPVVLECVKRIIDKRSGTTRVKLLSESSEEAAAPEPAPGP